MPHPASEIALIEAFADTKVIGLTINHEGMTETEITTAIVDYSEKLELPVTDALNRPIEHLVRLVLTAYPELQQKPVVAAE